VEVDKRMYLKEEVVEVDKRMYLKEAVRKKDLHNNFL
jgi:hypothetical protein